MYRSYQEQVLRDICMRLLKVGTFLTERMFQSSSVHRSHKAGLIVLFANVGFCD